MYFSAPPLSEVEILSSFGTRARQEYTTELFADFFGQRGQYAMQRFHSVAAHCLADSPDAVTFARDEFAADNGFLPQGYFSAKNTLELLNLHRVRGFMRGIGEADQVHAAIDIGTGATAVLALATAVMHPELRKMTAIELNPQSVTTAKKIIELCGFEDKIEVVCADGFLVPVEEVDMVVSETFHIALGFESGARLLHRYKDAARVLLPARADILAVAVPEGADDAIWQLEKVDSINFRNMKPRVEGTLTLPLTDQKIDVRAMSLLYSEQGTELIEPGADLITEMRTLKTLEPTLPDTAGRSGLSFSYIHSRGHPKASLKLIES